MFHRDLWHGPQDLWHLPLASHRPTLVQVPPTHPQVPFTHVQVPLTYVGAGRFRPLDFKSSQAISNPATRSGKTSHRSECVSWLKGGPELAGFGDWALIGRCRANVGLTLSSVIAQSEICITILISLILGDEKSQSNEFQFWRRVPKENPIIGFPILGRLPRDPPLSSSRDKHFSQISPVLGAIPVALHDPEPFWSDFGAHTRSMPEATGNDHRPIYDSIWRPQWGQAGGNLPASTSSTGTPAIRAKRRATLALGTRP